MCLNTNIVNWWHHSVGLHNYLDLFRFKNFTYTLRFNVDDVDVYLFFLKLWVPEHSVSRNISL
jgi:hypothetical protein